VLPFTLFTLVETNYSCRLKREYYIPVAEDITDFLTLVVIMVVVDTLASPPVLKITMKMLIISFNAHSNVVAE
jgi:hypothetical protein